MNALKNLKEKLSRSKSENKLSSGTTTKQTGKQLIDKPLDFDILLGRGKIAFNHVGNRRFRVFIGIHLRRYMEATNRMEKTLVVNAVVEAIQDAGGRFLKLDPKTKKWEIVSPKMAREKVGHALRDAVQNRTKLASDSAGRGGAAANEFGRRASARASASEVAIAKMRRSSVAEPPRGSILEATGDPRFSRSCGDLLHALKASGMAASARQVILELGGIDDDDAPDRIGRGGSSELDFDPLPFRSKEGTRTEEKLEPLPFVKRNHRLSETSFNSQATPKRDNVVHTKESLLKKQQSATTIPPVAVVDKSLDTGDSAEFSVMSESTNKKWFELASGEFSVATVDSKVFDDSDHQKELGEETDHDVPAHLTDKVNKALTDLEVSGEITFPGKKKGGSDYLRRRQSKSSVYSTASDIELSEEFSVMSLDTRAKIDKEFGVESEEFGLKSEEFSKASGDGPGLESEEFGFKSEDFLGGSGKYSKVVSNVPANASLTSAMRTSGGSRNSSMRISSTEFSLQSKDFDGIRASNMSESSDPMRSSSNEFLLRVAKAADMSFKLPPSADTADTSSSQNAAKNSAKISWNMDDMGKMETVEEGVAHDGEKSFSDILLSTEKTGTDIFGADAALLCPEESEDENPNNESDEANSTEFSVKSADWNSTLKPLAGS